MTLEEICSYIKNCRFCEQFSNVQSVVPAGYEWCEIMMIGEAPGKQETEKGEPFVGPAGQTLRAAINHRHIQLQYDEGVCKEIYMTNAVKCRPTRKSIKTTRLCNRKPTDEEISQCNFYLLAEIELVRPKVILCLGSTAYLALTQQKASVGRNRGYIKKFRGSPVIYTWHPSYLLQMKQKGIGKHHCEFLADLAFAKMIGYPEYGMDEEFFKENGKYLRNKRLAKKILSGKIKFQRHGTGDAVWVR